MLDRIVIVVWIIWTVWLYSVSGALTVVVYRSPRVWSPQVGEFVAARDFKYNAAASSVYIHPKIGSIGRTGFRKPFHQLPQFKHYPYNPYHFDHLSIGGYFGEEELLHNNGYKSKSKQVSTLTKHPVESLQDYHEYDSDLSLPEISPSYQIVRAPHDWLKNLLAKTSKVVDKKPTRMHLAPMPSNGISADRKTRYKRSIHPNRIVNFDNGEMAVYNTDDLINPCRRLLVRRPLLTVDDSMQKNKSGKTKLTEQTHKSTQSNATSIQQAYSIVSKKNNATLLTKQSLKGNNKISRRFGTTENGELPNPRAFPELNYKFGRKTPYTPVLESTSPILNTLQRDLQKLPKAGSAAPKTSAQSRDDFHKKNFHRMVQISHAMYPKKYQHAEHRENIKGTKRISRKDNRILKRTGRKHHKSIHDIELPVMYSNMKYSEYNRVPKETTKKTQINITSTKSSNMDPDDSKSNRVIKGTDNKMRSNTNDVDLSTIAVSTSTYSATSTTTTTARPDIVLSTRLPSLNSNIYETFQPLPFMPDYAPARPVGYTALNKPPARPTGFAANIIRWIFTGIPIPIHL